MCFRFRFLFCNFVQDAAELTDCKSEEEECTIGYTNAKKGSIIQQLCVLSTGHVELDSA